ncbi:amidohydrolase family protein [Candidatus Aminicenantes bacterium AC-335-A11]|jgi:imidazolonepropionase-like amidohydrolase|nr:amidohydrolase family protein [SCandidatus Aminicenantes bacterium Aminicenantia_JdfR_composite]MCP2618855.1 amidohydrolase family protein [Candidatus Aminicenantes bacterium AC-335-A11]MCP2620818.1 amidohydrolase family protein [Candidatus Aminicenantes bacterium AC-334-E05]
MRRKILLFFIFLISLNLTSLYAQDILLLKNGNIITISGENIMGGDILIKNGKIARIGKNLKAPSKAKVIDLKGKWVMPGIIDSHSHIAIEGGVNEMGDLIIAEVDVKDVINPEDINIWYALTGGVTTIHTMHGSGNPIGGRGIVLKLRWGKSAEEMIFKGAPRTIKWALGENPKQTNFSRQGKPRYPRTRMGVEASIRKIFEEAKDYMKKWEEYKKALKKRKKGPLPLPPRKDYRLEVIADILKGKYWVHCHGYQSEEMVSIMKLCHEYGVKLVSFEHGLEGYRITNELVKYGVAVSTFADSWAYKWEAYHTMPHSTALMVKRGVLVALNSDSAERMRRLYHEAAKTIRFGDLSEIEALKTITINPAKILGIDKWVGTIEVGKDADLAIFSKHPLDPYTICEMTIIDGQIYFDRAKYLEEMKKKEKEAKKKEEKGKKI